MLIDEPAALRPDVVLNIVAGGKKGKELEKGVYLTHHYGSSHWPEYGKYEEWTSDLSISSYGVCDNVEQIFEQCPEIKESQDRKFIVRVTPVVRAEQHPTGGWRWHKWGAYIGKHDPQHEYLYDEKDIDQVLCYHIYELKK